MPLLCLLKSLPYHYSTAHSAPLCFLFRLVITINYAYITYGYSWQRNCDFNLVFIGKNAAPPTPRYPAQVFGVP
nr:MAG TPA: hypothetical protein [Caudoviricetes sp.]